MDSSRVLLKGEAGSERVSVDRDPSGARCADPDFESIGSVALAHGSRAGANFKELAKVVVLR
jgi:hypothetical protein